MPLSTPTRHGRAPPPPHEVAAQSVPHARHANPNGVPGRPQDRALRGAQQFRHLWGGKLVSRTRTAVLSGTPDSDCRGSAHWHRVPWPVRGPALPPPARTPRRQPPQYSPTRSRPARSSVQMLVPARPCRQLWGREAQGQRAPLQSPLASSTDRRPVESARGRPGSACAWAPSASPRCPPGEPDTMSRKPHETSPQT